MKSWVLKVIFLTVLIATGCSFVYSQEWRNIKKYRQETGKELLTSGEWLKKDRLKQTDQWKNANKYNLKEREGHKKYQSIKQIRDFYIWFDEVRKKQGHEVQWLGIAAIAANQLAQFDVDFIRVLIIRDRELVEFARKGSALVFAFAFSGMNKIFFMDGAIKGSKAQEWDNNHGLMEQCTILEPLYQKLSPHAINKLERMAKRKGLFFLGIPKALEFEGKINDCRTRFNHGKNKLLPYYLKM